MKQLLKITIQFLIIILFCVVIFENTTFPWIWNSLAISILVLYKAFKATSPRIKLAFAYLFVIPFVLFCIESYCSIAFGAEHSLNEEKIFNSRGYTIIKPSMHIEDPDLGWKAIPNKRYKVTIKNSGFPSFSVFYTIQKNGLRNVPTSDLKSPNCLAFMGGSFMFGDGLEDYETLPSLVGALSKKKYNIFNFAFPGYGSHHMLKMVENGSFKQKLSKCTSLKIIYLSINDHFYRAAGKHWWGERGPLYSLKKGKVSTQGSFAENSLLKNFPTLKRYLRKSAFYRVLKGRFKTLTKADTDLYIAIVNKFISLTKKQFPESQFFLIQNSTETTTALEASKRERSLVIKAIINLNIKRRFVGEIIEDYHKTYPHYRINANNPHPNQRFNKRIADFIVNKWWNVSTN